MERGGGGEECVVCCVGTGVPVQRMESLEHRGIREGSGDGHAWWKCLCVVGFQVVVVPHRSSAGALYHTIPSFHCLSEQCLYTYYLIRLGVKEDGGSLTVTSNSRRDIQVSKYPVCMRYG